MREGVLVGPKRGTTPLKRAEPMKALGAYVDVEGAAAFTKMVQEFPT